LKSATKMKGGSPPDRVRSLGTVASLIGKTTKDRLWGRDDPLEVTKGKLKSDRQRLKDVEEEVSREIQEVVKTALRPIEPMTEGTEE
jgi:Lon protease-like protein